MWQSSAFNSRSLNLPYSQHHQQRPAEPDLLGSSPSSSTGGTDDFGAFTSASPIPDKAPQEATADRRPHAGPPIPRDPTRSIDLLTDDHDYIDSWTNDNIPGYIAHRLPPRPSEISPDYVPPPIRSPRRLSSFSFPGPSSPPQVSNIVFDPLDNAVEPTSPQTRSHETAHSKLFSTLTTTTRVASKWKSVLDPNLFSAQDRSGPPSATALPIDIDHSTPFSPSDRWAIPHAPIAGAPTFFPQSVKSARSDAPEDTFRTMLRDRRSTTRPVLTQSVADQLRRFLPARQRLASTWSLIFSLDQHGASLSTLYRLIEQHAASRPNTGNILVVHDESGHVFGAFINEHLLKREGQYYGGGESFLFKAIGDAIVKPFRWTGKNQYFALCENNMISFGGGSGAYGLILDSTFTHNSTASCLTFDNEILNTPETTYDKSAVPFDCMGLEVWTVV